MAQSSFSTRALVGINSQNHQYIGWSEFNDRYHVLRIVGAPTAHQVLPFARPSIGLSPHDSASQQGVLDIDDAQPIFIHLLVGVQRHHISRSRTRARIRSNVRLGTTSIVGAQIASDESRRSSEWILQFVKRANACAVQRRRAHSRSGGLRHGTPLVGCSALLARRLGWYIAPMTFMIEIEREDDGRWLVEVPDLPGALAYGHSRDEAVARVQALALRVIAERLEHREAPAEFINVTFEAA
jgi:predicted RNase H-like HicB family nuclease